jgi:transcriptional regulator with XRE-family HTH domain
MSPEIRLFGSAVRARRTALKVSQGVVASLAGIRRERVSFIESGLVPNAAEMAAIARALGCSVRELLAPATEGAMALEAASPGAEESPLVAQ